MKKAIFLLFLALSSLHAFAGSEWQLKKVVDGIRISTRKEDSSNYKSVKVECTVQGTLSSLVALLFDIERNHEWVYHIKTSRLLKRISDHELIYYSEVVTPWPFTNRDLISHLKAEQPEPGKLTIESRAEPNAIPRKNGLVRIPFSHSVWTVTSMTSTFQKIEYTIQFDPGGSIPAWLTNMFLTEGPSETFQKIRERVRLPEYQHASFSFFKS